VEDTNLNVRKNTSILIKKETISFVSEKYNLHKEITNFLSKAIDSKNVFLYCKINAPVFFSILLEKASSLDLLDEEVQIDEITINENRKEKAIKEIKEFYDSIPLDKLQYAVNRSRCVTIAKKY